MSPPYSDQTVSPDVSPTPSFVDQNHRFELVLTDD
jgi:hypothetical protein